jgi:hypothetical protein
MDIDDINAGLLQPQIKKLERKEDDDTAQGMAVVLKAIPVILHEIREIKKQQAETRNVLNAVRNQNSDIQTRQTKHEERLDANDIAHTKLDETELNTIIAERRTVRSVLIKVGVVASLVVTTFGLVMWEKVNYIASLNDQHIEIVVRQTLVELGVLK